MTTIAAWIRPLLRFGYCAEAGAAILFFGSLAHSPDLHDAGVAALAELIEQGYRVPSENDPVRVFPTLTNGQFSGNHAGGWRPGSIYLRRQPKGGLDAAIYLRHELFHEASHRSCGGLWPTWIEEAAAMRFSGELSNVDAPSQLNAAELEALAADIRSGNQLSAKARSLLGRLAVTDDWPARACGAPPQWQSWLGSNASAGAGYLLMNLISGRILEQGGDLQTALPAGSLLKIPYAAALRNANPEVLATELATSDTDKLLQRRAQFQPELYRRFLQEPTPPSPPTIPSGERDWRVYLGERDADGGFPIIADLPELALTLRAALLSQPAYFRGLTQNGSLPGSTLAARPDSELAILRRLQAMAKTGTVSSADGQAEIGHLMVAWPAGHPVYLAVFRQRGVNGAGVLAYASPRLQRWQQQYPAEFAAVRVRLLSATERNSWQADADCPELNGPAGRFSRCGSFTLVSSARGSRSVRLIAGLLNNVGDGPDILETDAETYADGVLSAEAQTLTASARRAMRALVIWNGSHGKHRHSESQALCDTTHCMVFLGEAPNANSRSGERTDPNLLRLLDALADGQTWLPFANGGDRRWIRQIAAAELEGRFAEQRIDAIRRERRKTGELLVRLYYPESEEVLACEVFRNTLKLPSCPDRIEALSGGRGWQFEGVGSGHGLGLSILRAQALAEAGYSAEQILRDAFTAAGE
ncbi:hypothetical protein [Methylomonas sp. UP202]|uniref:hypothetical protein n=1 Tax=Methylomonas sp. UP202 TaxID=3040943 RepID=UPI002478EA34|nr:hypothetical protein [Methylomonas sp. UP202]WGS86396.1 hypothetical protein QC632_01225 [Methylomonas sp. UP202]